MPDPDVDAIVADLRGTGLHLGPGTKGWIDDEVLAEIAAVVAESGVPVHLVLVMPPEDGDIHAGDDLLVRVHDAGGPDGLYIGVNNLWSYRTEAEPLREPYVGDGTEVNLAVQQWGDVAGHSDLTYDVPLVLSDGNRDDAGVGGPYPLGEGVLEIVRALGDGTFADRVAEAEAGQAARVEQREEGEATTSTPSVLGDSGSAAEADPGTAVVLAVVLAVVAVSTAVALLARRARRRAKRTFVLPDSVLERVREAEDADLERQARKAVIALGERIEAAELRGSGSAAWAAALDHYDAAGRLLPATDEKVDPLDTVGAIVLAGRGTEALTAAVRGAAFSPSTPCFLNPLHGTAVRDRTLEHGGERVRAPICPACQRDLEADRRPDILDVVVRGTPQHYFETDREPWASTGFGALEPDLVTRLHRDLR